MLKWLQLLSVVVEWCCKVVEEKGREGASAQKINGERGGSNHPGRDTKSGTSVWR
jgi:hypothetical protein